ncbi:unnamed protein product [Linum tenue]|uniref:Uncharacterized protein n=1 Tax=Linum tenue TaxID=586396 RepID=A0AAV0RPD7_9ROSI|nr:unnamed protein product [Linum tenue]
MCCIQGKQKFPRLS